MLHSPQKLHMYRLQFDIGEHWVLAKDDEDAAWQAWDFSVQNKCELIDVIPDEQTKETLFP